MSDDVEAGRQGAIARLQEQAALAEAKAADRYWQNGPYNVQQWVARAFHGAISLLKESPPHEGEARAAYLARMSEAVGRRRELGPDADDEGWFSGATDEACLLIKRDQQA